MSERGCVAGSTLLTHFLLCCSKVGKGLKLRNGSCDKRHISENDEQNVMIALPALFCESRQISRSMVLLYISILLHFSLR